MMTSQFRVYLITSSLNLTIFIFHDLLKVMVWGGCGDYLIPPYIQDKINVLARSLKICK